MTEILHEIAERYDFDIETMDVQPDHIHIFCSAPPRYAPAQVAGIMKSVSAKKLLEEFPKVKKEFWGDKKVKKVKRKTPYHRWLS